MRKRTNGLASKSTTTRPVRATASLIVISACVSCGSGDTERTALAELGHEHEIASVQAALSTSSAYSATILGDAPVGYWRLGELTGPTAFDSSPSHNDGTYTGTYADSAIPLLNQPGAIVGDADGSAYFTISNNSNHTPPTQSSFVAVPHAASQAPTNPALSLEAWFTMSQRKGAIPQTYSAIIEKTSRNATDGYGLYWYVNTLYFYINSSNIRVGVPINFGEMGTFHHVVATYDGSRIKI